MPDSEVDRIVRFAETHAPVFVVGMERGGTSILYRTLTGAPEFRPVSGEQETFVFADPERVVSGEARDMTVQYLGGAEAFAAFRDWYAGLTGWPEPWMLPRRVATAYFYFASQVTGGGARVLEKTPRHAFSMEIMTRFFPNCRIVAVLRNPFGVIESYRKRLERERQLGNPPENYAWLERDPDQICAHLEKITAAVWAGVRASPRNVMVVRYEEILRDPELAFGLIGRFCDIGSIPVEASGEAPAPGKAHVDPLLKSGRIYTGNAFRSSLSIDERIGLVTRYPQLFAGLISLGTPVG